MSDFQNFSLDLNGDFFLLLALCVFLALYAWFSYRFTIPVVSGKKRYFLLTIRTLVILFILFLIFEPVLSLFFNLKEKPVHFVAFDDSQSIRSGKDSTAKLSLMQSITDRFIQESGQQNFRFIRFSQYPANLDAEALPAITYQGSATDIDAVVNSLPDDVRVASLTLITDGIINKGANPITRADRLGYPIYTIGIGDTAQKKDIGVRSIIHNDVLYAGITTKININIFSTGYNDETVTVRLYEEDKQIGSELIKMQDNRVNTAIFNYTPINAGEKKITAAVEIPKGDEQPANNKKIIYLKVLSDKIKVHLIAGYVSPDVSFLKSALQSDTSLSVTTNTQISENKFLEGSYNKTALEKSDVIFLVNFPVAETSPVLLEDIRRQISLFSKPIFLLITPFSDVQKFRSLLSVLPVDLIRAGSGKREVLPSLNESFRLHSLIKAGAQENALLFNSLPPIIQPDWVLKNKVGSQSLVKIKMNSIQLDDPLFSLSSIGNIRSAIFVGANLWRWKLNTNTGFNYNNFIISITRWLAAVEDKKLLSIKPLKKLFSENEKIEFSAELLDESFNALEGEEIKLVIKSKSFRRELRMNELGKGLYESEFDGIPPGEYTYRGELFRNNRLYAADSGRINVGEINIETVNLTTDAQFLSALAYFSGGKAYFGDTYNDIFNEYKVLTEKRTQIKTTVSEHPIWSNQYILFFIILLLSIEWFIRKRSGML